MHLQSYDGAIDIFGPVNTDPAGLYTSSMYAKYDITIADHLTYAGGNMHLESFEGNIDIAGPVVTGYGSMQLWAADGIYIDDYITSGTYMDFLSFDILHDSFHRVAERSQHLKSLRPRVDVCHGVRRIKVSNFSSIRLHCTASH